MTDLIQRLRDWHCHDCMVQDVTNEAADALEVFIEWKKVAMEEARCAEKEIERLQAALCELPRMLAESERFQRERDEVLAKTHDGTLWQPAYMLLMEERDRFREALEGLLRDMQYGCEANGYEVYQVPSATMKRAREALR